MRIWEESTVRRLSESRKRLTSCRRRQSRPSAGSAPRPQSLKTRLATKRWSLPPRALQGRRRRPHRRPRVRRRTTLAPQVQRNHAVVPRAFAQSPSPLFAAEVDRFVSVCACMFFSCLYSLPCMPARYLQVPVLGPVPFSLSHL